MLEERVAGRTDVNHPLNIERRHPMRIILVDAERHGEERLAVRLAENRPDQHVTFYHWRMRLPLLVVASVTWPRAMV